MRRNRWISLIVMVAALRTWSDFNPSSVATWLFMGGLRGLLFGIAAVYLGMETRRQPIKV